MRFLNFTLAGQCGWSTLLFLLRPNQQKPSTERTSSRISGLFRIEFIKLSFGISSCFVDLLGLILLPTHVEDHPLPCSSRQRFAQHFQMVQRQDPNQNPWDLVPQFITQKNQKTLQKIKVKVTQLKKQHVDASNHQRNSPNLTLQDSRHAEPQQSCPPCGHRRPEPLSQARHKE